MPDLQLFMGGFEYAAYLCQQKSQKIYRQIRITDCDNLQNVPVMRNV